MKGRGRGCEWLVPAGKVEGQRMRDDQPRPLSSCSSARRKAPRSAAQRSTAHQVELIARHNAHQARLQQGWQAGAGRGGRAGRG